MTHDQSPTGIARVERPRSPLDDHPFAGKKFLLVDDDFRNSYALSVLLERGRAAVVVTESGHDALAFLEHAIHTDMVLMDIMMPVMDGYDTMRSIRTQERFARLPIIAVTGKVVDGERQRCLDAGANDYVPKPVNTAELLAAIGPWLTNAA
jgi:CheY-like chemotaxis protein